VGTAVDYLRRHLDGVVITLTVAIVGGLLIRVAGTHFCLPIEHCHPDEHYLVGPAMHMVKTGDLNPHLFVYPTLFIYLLMLVYALTFLGGVSAGMWSSPGEIKAPLFLLTGRIAAALLGTGTLGGVYVAGKRLLDPASAAVGALALAFMPSHVADSHYVATDVPAGFFSVVALCAAARVACEGTRRNYIIAGLLVGFATAAKYNAALVAINLPIAHWLNSRRERFWDANLLRALGWMVLGFLIACPYALFDLPHFLDGVATEIAHYKREHIGHEGQFNRLFYLQFLASRGFGPVLTGLGIFGLWMLLRRYKRQHLLLLAFPTLYILFIGSYRVRFVRNLMPALPYFALWIGHGAVEAFRQIRATWAALGRIAAWKLALPGLAAALAIPGFIALDETIALVRPDTRARAREWIETNLPRGTGIYLQSWSVDALTPGKYFISQNGLAWDYYIATDRLTWKYYNMRHGKPEKYIEVREAVQHRPVAVFEGREENAFYCTASPTVVIFARDPARFRVQPARRPAPPPAPRPPPPPRPPR
jgi:hypothetical protein